VLVDEKMVRDVKGAQYDDNLLLIKVAEVTGKTVELRITVTTADHPRSGNWHLPAGGEEVEKAVVQRCRPSPLACPRGLTASALLLVLVKFPESRGDGARSR